MKKKRKRLTGPVQIDPAIHIVRNERVILDTDLARIYGVPTFRLNEAVKRNRDRFPEDFLFQLSHSEMAILTSQFAMSKSGSGGRRTLPFAFTEHGALMAANILSNRRAVQMSIFVVRAFVKMRQTLATSKAFMDKLHELESKLTGRMDVQHKIIVFVLEELKRLMEPSPQLPPPKRRPIGFGREAEEQGSSALVFRER